MAGGRVRQDLRDAQSGDREVLAHVAEGDAEDIARAVAAARAAFNGPWSRVKPADRQRLLLKLADLVERDIEEFAALDTLDLGAPISRTRNNRQRALGMTAVPFAGYKMSGYGRESGVQHLEEYLNVKSVWIKTD
jgi:aldehyde dehydrogenase (NAD+)